MRCRVLSLPSGTHRSSACSGQTSWRRSREPPLAAAATLSPHALVERARKSNKKTQQWSAVVAATPLKMRGSESVLRRKHSPTSVKVVHTKAVVDVAMTEGRQAAQQRRGTCDNIGKTYGHPLPLAGARGAHKERVAHRPITYQ
jgi:hypothetical protein